MINPENDQGPQPVGNRKRRLNGADKFYVDHQEEHESRARPSGGDSIDKVHQHNSGYPKLHDELAKKKATTKVTEIHSRNMTRDFDPRCRACVKLATFNELRNMTIRPKCCGPYNRSNKPRNKSRNKRRVSRPRGNTSSVSKRAKAPRKLKKSFLYAVDDCITSATKVWVNKSCQFSSCVNVTTKNSGPTSKNPLRIKSSSVNNKSYDAAPQREQQLSPTVSEKLDLETRRNSKQSHITSESQKTSISGYSSYKSLKHEPMV